ncbi:MAG: hypothetical protein HYZ53_10545 [Planctomycetes bacterium]|nr:hypothetical protein [Planctomycetota bacterium]
MLLPFSDVQPTDLPRVGGKGFRLGLLLQAGAAVPDGFCLTTRAREYFLEAPGLLDWIRERTTAIPAGREAERLAEVRARMHDEPLPADLAHLIRKTVASRLDGARLAVRSSGVQEDLAHASFAGQYETHLNVTGAEAVEQAVRKCWSSTWKPGVWTYCRDHQVDPRALQMGVVVQRMVPADAAGVLFTVNPLTGRDREMVIEAAWGLGEALVSGQVSPDRYAYDWYRECETERRVARKELEIVPIDAPPFTVTRPVPADRIERPVLTSEEVRELAAQALAVQARFGCPQDIEWARAEGRCWCLQARPITRIAYSSVPGEWTTADFKDGGVSSSVCTPFMWSLYDFIWERVMPAYLTDIHVLDASAPPKLWGDMFFARPYWNVGEVKAALMRLPGFKERAFDRDLGIELTYEGEGRVTPTTLGGILRGLRVLSALDRSFRERLEQDRRFAAAQREKLHELRRDAPDGLDTKTLFARFRKLIEEHYNESESSYFLTIFDNSNAKLSFKELFDSVNENGRFDGDLLALFGGLEDLSHLRPMVALWELARAIRRDAASLRHFREESVADLVAAWRAGAAGPFDAELRGYLAEHGYHSAKELDITVPCWREDPTFVFEGLRSLLREDAEPPDPRDASRRQRVEAERARDRIASALGSGPWARLFPFKRRAFLRRLALVREFLWWREELRDLSTRMYNLIRTHALAVGARLAVGGALERGSDVFLLPFPDVFRTMYGESTRDETRALVEKNRRYLESFRSFANPNEIGDRYGGDRKRAEPAAGADGALLGIACSPGRVEGRARVIADLADAERLERGDVLVTRFTDPGWTCKFGMLSAVVTETGGLLSHAAVISREYGIPAVLAVEGATRRIPDGRRVVVDGGRGHVELPAK